MSFSKSGNKSKQNNIKSKKKKVENKINISFIRVFLLTLAAICIAGTCIIVGVIKSIIDDAPDISTINVAPEGYASIIYDQSGNEIAKLVGSEANRIYVELDQIPNHLKNALIALEDERFWDHNGIDIKGMVRAVFANLQAGEKDEGASTITQQLLKNNVLGGAKTYKRKIQEQYLAIQLENTLSKEKILEYYLNTINLNKGFGVQTAAKRYFNKDVWDLTLSESAVIVSIAQSPVLMDPIKYPEKNQSRQRIALSNMLRLKMITQEEYNEAIADDVYSRIQEYNVEFNENNSSVNSYFVDEVILRVIEDLILNKGYTETQASNLIYRGGLSIYVTQDMQIQNISDAAFEDPANFPAKTKDFAVQLAYRLSVEYPDGTTKHFSENNLEKFFKETDSKFDLLFKSEEDAQTYIDTFKNSVCNEAAGDKVLPGSGPTFTDQPQASLVIIDYHNGHVKAIVGGRGEKSGNLTLNRATNTYRQPGSCFKVLSTYLPAIDTGAYTLASVEEDIPYNYLSGTPVNNWYNSGYIGTATVREAIAHSMNIIAVKTLTSIEPELGYDYLISLGFTSLYRSFNAPDGRIFSDIGQPLALGGITKGISNLEMTAAYGAIANDGIYIEPIFYTKVLDGDGTLLLDKQQVTKRVMKDSTAFLLTDAMVDVVTSNIGTAAGARFKNVKMPISGKSGTTTNTVDYWFSGYTPYYVASVWAGYDMNTSVKEGFHFRLWRAALEPIHADLPYKEFVKPASVISVKVCKKSGLLPVEGLCDQDLRGSMVYTEYFESGTEPKEYCTTHVRADVCSVSGQLATEFCPLNTITSKVFFIRSEQVSSTDVIKDSAYELREDTPRCTIHGAVVVPPVTPGNNNNNNNGNNGNTGNTGDDDVDPGYTDPDQEDPPVVPNIEFPTNIFD